MVTTRAQSNRDSRIEQTETDTSSNDDSITKVTDFSSRTYFPENIEELCHLMHRMEQRFLDTNRQIGELTRIMRAHTEKTSNGKEENGQNVRNIETSLRSDSFKTLQINRVTV